MIISEDFKNNTRGDSVLQGLDGGRNIIRWFENNATKKFSKSFYSELFGGKIWRVFLALTNANEPQVVISDLAREIPLLTNANATHWSHLYWLTRPFSMCILLVNNKGWSWLLVMTYTHHKQWWTKLSSWKWCVGHDQC